MSNIVLLRMASVVLSMDADQEDKVGWLKAGASGFTVKSAYELACKHDAAEQWVGWKHPWKTKTVQRVRVFSWILSHEKLITNKERWSRQITVSPDCSRCHQGVEDTLHAVSDCPWARQVWEALIPTEQCLLLSKSKRLVAAHSERRGLFEGVRAMDGEDDVQLIGGSGDGGMRNCSKEFDGVCSNVFVCYRELGGGERGI